MTTVSSRIRTLREQAELTQAALSAAVGVSRGHLAMIETGKDLPGRDVMAAFATYFDVSLDWLARGSGDMRPTKPVNEREAALLFAFRQLPEDEAELHLNLMLKRVRQKSS